MKKKKKKKRKKKPDVGWSHFSEGSIGTTDHGRRPSVALSTAKLMIIITNKIKLKPIVLNVDISELKGNLEHPLIWLNQVFFLTGVVIRRFQQMNAPRKLVCPSGKKLA